MQNDRNASEAAYILVSKYHISRSIIHDIGLASYHALERAQKAATDGYDIGICGRHAKLNEADRNILKKQLIDEIRKRNHIWPHTVVRMVCKFFLSLRIHLIRQTQESPNIPPDLLLSNKSP